MVIEEIKARNTAPDKIWWTMAGAILLVGFALRVAGARGDLWLDEIWSLSKLPEFDTLFSPILIPLSDNNHPLNTIWMMIVGSDGPPWAHRTLSIASSTGALVFAGLIGARIDRTTALLYMATSAVFVPGVLWGSEARGYGLVILFSVASVWATEGYLRREHGWWSLGLALFAPFGLLSNLTFLLTLIGVGLWSFSILIHRHGLIGGLYRFLAVFGAPIATSTATLALVAAGWVRHGFTPGEVSSFESIIFTMAWSHDVVFSSIWWTPYAHTGVQFAVAAAVLVAVLAWLAARARTVPLLGLYLLSVCLLPLVIFLFSLLPNGYARYFLGGYCLIPFILADFARLAWQGGGAMRLVGTAIAVWFLGSSLAANAKLIRFQRGQYQDAVSFLAANTPSGETIQVALAARNSRIPFLHAVDRISLEQAVAFADISESDWYLHQSNYWHERPAGTVCPRTRSEDCFIACRSFRHSDLNGFTWTILRRVDAEPVATCGRSD